MPPYRHTQIGYPILVAIPATLILIVVGVPGETPLGGRVAFFGVVGAILLMFSTLTVEADSNALRIWFGLGFPRFQWPIREIASARAVRNPWYTGWGIRWIGQWVYNVSGLRAVEITLRNGRKFRIGTNEPEALAAALGRVG